MANKFITKTKLRTIIRLYEDRMGLKTIAVMARTSRNTVKKHIHRWTSLKMSFKEFQSKNDTELYDRFCISEVPSNPNPRRDTLEALLPDIRKSLSRKGMTTMKQWQKYIKEHPDGYGLTQFRISVQRYCLINNPSMRMEHKAGDKMFVDYTGDKLWIYPAGELPRQVKVFVAILGCTY